MRELFTITAVIVTLFIAQTAFGQSSSIQQSSEPYSTEQISVVSQPSAKVSYKTPRKISPMIIKVNSLCNGDDALTEMVILEIYKHKDIKINDVIGDDEYLEMTRDEQSDCISESEVIEIIKLIKK